MGNKLAVSWLGRLIQGRRLDRNPLRRASDRAETLMLTALVIVFLAAATVVTLAAGAWVQDAGHRTQLAQEASRLQVPALVLQLEPATEGYVSASMPARARWTDPSGTVTTGEVTVPSATVAGTTIPVWITRDGQPSDPPLQNSQVAAQVLLAEIGSVLVTALAVTVTGAVAHRALDKRRMAAWDDDWQTTGPRWTTRA